ncbi:DUF1168-domain-containing protein [Byssothecium circinans]|uniref:DUF1168-domain-containing protein n=1 Tax=Byssothecium circinans TaxID=147558 RepID=A0A6A5TIL6_9PLEO|nr:DUF1168-domain-containing protein [Byssothecium circinans]
MSEPIPESIPTSSDRRSKRPLKKRVLNTRSALASDVDALFAKPDREIHIPGSEAKKGLAAPPEIVANVQGSSAGAGSGEFHVYKASRRREYERLRLMAEEVQTEEEEKAARERREELERRDREKTERNRAKREKQRARKMKAKKGSKDKEETGTADGKKKLAPKANVPSAAEDNEDRNGKMMNGGEVKDWDEVGLMIEDED